MCHPQLRPLRPGASLAGTFYTSVHDGLRCLQPMWVQCLGFTRQLSATYCAHLVLISKTSSSPNVPFNFLHPFGFICRFPPVGLSTTSCLYAVSIYEFLLRPCAAQQLPACIWFQYLTSQGVQSPSPCDTLGFPPPSRSALFFSISTLHTSVPHLGAFTWLQYLNFPPLCLL